MTSSIVGLNAALDTCLFDHLRIIADWYEDAGEEKMSDAYRWLADDAKMPFFYTNAGEWRWWWEDPDGKMSPYSLPSVIMASLHSNGYCKMSMAYLEAAQTLAKSGLVLS